jgi:hypothetical protein
MKKAFFLLVCSVIVGLPLNLYAEGFYVIPGVKEKIVEVPVCNDATSVGADAFILKTDSYLTLNVGDIFTTPSGKLVEITGGTYNSYVYYHAGEYFRVAPITLPVPALGVKGPFYLLYNGQIAFAKYL